MRNLKRVLSLTLASVMLLGMMVVGSSAADYADVTSEHNTEAIEVLQAAGIMVGDNGNFNPDQNVTRNEMAVVISNLMNYRVATYANTSPFTDVPAWAEPYVAACYANKITSGVGPTTYGGSNSVTAGQAALMLMKALGYFQFQSDFGEDWLLATTRVGSKILLFNGVEAGVREPMTRNDLAKLVLNTLEATLVEPDDNIINVSTADVAVEFGSVKYYYRVDHTNDPDYRAIGKANKTAVGINGTSGVTMELGEVLYEGNLKKDDIPDAYGRPATRWTYGLEEVGYYPDKPIATYSAKVSTGDLYALVGKQVLDDIASYKSGYDGYGNRVGYTFNVWADGGHLVNNVYGSDFDTSKPVRYNYFSENRNASGAAGVKDQANQAGKGVQTEVYLDGDGNLVIVYINTYVMKATDDYNSSKGTLNIELVTEPRDTVAPATGLYTSLGVTQLSADDFDIANYKEDDYILYTVAGGKVQEIAPAEVIKGEVSAYSLENSVTIDGTQYDYAKRIEGVKNETLYNAGLTGRDKASASASTEYRVGDVASVVVDQYGYVLYVDSAAISLGNYLYVNAAVRSSGIGSNVTAQVYLTDGTKAEVTLDTVTDKDNKKIDLDTVNSGNKLPQTSDQTGADVLNGWYSYSVGSDGKYSIREAKTNLRDTDNTVKNATKIEGEKVAFVTHTGTLTGPAASLVGNASSVLVVDDGDDVKVYTGVRNFPTIEAKSGTFTVSAFKEKDDSGKTYVAAAFVDASNTNITVEDGTQDSILYVLNKDTQYVDTAKNETIYVYNAVVNGEAASIKFKEANAPGTTGEYTFYSRWSVDADGYYKVNGTSTKNTYRSAVLHGIVADPVNNIPGDVVKVSNSSVQIGNGTYIVTEDTDIVVVLVPDSSKTGSNPYKSGKVSHDLMIDKDADYEVKTVKSGKNLDSMLGGYKAISGKIDGFVSDSTSQVLETLYVTVYGVQD